MHGKWSHGSSLSKSPEPCCFPKVRLWHVVTDGYWTKPQEAEIVADWIISAQKLSQRNWGLTYEFWLILVQAGVLSRDIFSHLFLSSPPHCYVPTCILHCIEVKTRKTMRSHRNMCQWTVCANSSCTHHILVNQHMKRNHFQVHCWQPNTHKWEVMCAQGRWTAYCFINCIRCPCWLGT